MPVIVRVRLSGWLTVKMILSVVAPGQIACAGIGLILGGAHAKSQEMTRLKPVLTIDQSVVSVAVTVISVTPSEYLFGMMVNGMTLVLKLPIKLVRPNSNRFSFLTRLWSEEVARTERLVNGVSESDTWNENVIQPSWPIDFVVMREKIGGAFDVSAVKAHCVRKTRSTSLHQSANF